MWGWKVHVPILVDEKYVEPIILILRHVHSDSVAPQLEMHSRVFDVAHAIQSQVSGTFTKQYWSNGYARVLRVGISGGDHICPCTS